MEARARKRRGVPGQRHGALTSGGPVSPHFGNQGGPIIAKPDVYIAFWGPAWITDPTHQARQSDLTQFMKDLLQSDYVNILTQYGVGNGPGKCGRVFRSSNLPRISGQLDEASLHTAVRGMVEHGDLPEPGHPSQLALMIFFDESIEFRDRGIAVVLCEPRGDNAFGYHNFCRTPAGHMLYYAVVPGLSDACLRRTCPGGTGCTLHLNQSLLDRQTQVASHEFCEMVTDPEGNAWCDPQSGNEVGDICNGDHGIISVSGRQWNVQHMYSYADDQRGRPPCILRR